MPIDGRHDYSTPGWASLCGAMDASEFRPADFFDFLFVRPFVILLFVVVMLGFYGSSNIPQHE